jgi:alpha-galactosidase
MLAKRNSYKFNTEFLQGLPVDEVAGGWRVKSQPSIRVPFRGRRFYRHGWQSWSFSGWLSAGHTFPTPPSHPMAIRMNEDLPYASRLDRVSAGVAMLEDEHGNALLLGAADPDGRVFYEENALRGACEEGSGDWFIATGAADSLLEAYARFLQTRYGAPRHAEAPRVWCSWYSLYYFITQPVLLQVLEAFSDLPFDVFQIDDGWQQAVGDWQPNQKFPAGMDGLAHRIHATGRMAGLWLAPFLVHERSRLFREHPEWLLRDPEGQPLLAARNWGGRVYALDVTQTAVQDWLVALMRQVRRWGYEYVKLDFLYAAALPAQRQREMPREQAYRLGLEILRYGLGDAFLLACGAPILPSLGLCDAIRISPDVASYWQNLPYQRVSGNSAPGLQNALYTSLHRLWLRPLVHLDPDVAYFRRRFLHLSERQQNLQRDLAWICGYRATSDLPWWLTPAEREALRAFWTYQPQVQRDGAYRFLLEDRPVDFTPVLQTPPRLPLPSSLASHLGFLQDALWLGGPALLAVRHHDLPGR